MALLSLKATIIWLVYIFVVRIQYFFSILNSAQWKTINLTYIEFYKIITLLCFIVNFE